MAKSQTKMHKGEGSQEVLFVSVLSEGHQRGEERCHLSRGQLVMSVRALFVLYGQYVRLYQLAPCVSSIILLYAESLALYLPFKTRSNSSNTPSICHSHFEDKDFYLQYATDSLHISKFLVLLLQPVPDVVIVGLHNTIIAN